MRKILLILIASVSIYSVQAQTSKVAPWKELQAFHNVMAATYHPAEEGNLAPLKQKINELYTAVKLFQASPIPVTYKPEETQIQLRLLLDKVFSIQTAILNNAPDADLMELITSAHDIFHNITGECKKDEK